MGRTRSVVACNVRARPGRRIVRTAEGILYVARGLYTLWGYIG